MNTKTIEVVNTRSCDSKWPPLSLKEFIFWVESKLEQIPSYYHDSAEIDIDAYCDYEEFAYPRIVITYERPMLPQEFSKHTQEEVTRLREDVQWAKNRLESAEFELKRFLSA